MQGSGLSFAPQDCSQPSLAGTQAVGSCRLSLGACPVLSPGPEPHTCAQEIVPLNASNVVMGASAEAAAAWDGLIDDALNREAGCAPAV